MTKILTLLFSLAAFVSVLTAADSAIAADNGAGPCRQIEQTCKNAGFISGDWKKGDGLWSDCVDPIMQGVTTVPGATKPLPTVDSSVVSACKAKNPKFGRGKVGSK